MLNSSKGHILIVKMLLDVPGIEVNIRNKVSFITRQLRSLYVSLMYIYECRSFFVRLGWLDSPHACFF